MHTVSVKILVRVCSEYRDTMGAFEFKERTQEGGEGQTGLEPYRPHRYTWKHRVQG